MRTARGGARSSSTLLRYAGEELAQTGRPANLPTAGLCQSGTNRDLCLIYCHISSSLANPSMTCDYCFAFCADHTVALCLYIPSAPPAPLANPSPTSLQLLQSLPLSTRAEDIHVASIVPPTSYHIFVSHARRRHLHTRVRRSSSAFAHVRGLRPSRTTIPSSLSERKNLSPWAPVQQNRSTPTTAAKEKNSPASLPQQGLNSVSSYPRRSYPTCPTEPGQRLHGSRANPFTLELCSIFGALPASPVDRKVWLAYVNCTEALENLPSLLCITDLTNWRDMHLPVLVDCLACAALEAI